MKEMSGDGETKEWSVLEEGPKQSGRGQKQDQEWETGENSKYIKIIRPIDGIAEKGLIKVV